MSVRLKQVYPDRLILEVEGASIELNVDDVLNRIREFVKIVGELPDDEEMKKIIRKLAEEAYEKKTISIKKPDFTKMIGVEL